MRVVLETIAFLKSKGLELKIAEYVSGFYPDCGCNACKKAEQ
jgi:hypothetical protein